MSAPPVTVLMSVFNGGAYVGEAIQSILDQTLPDFEFLIIDDASTDGTAEVLAKFRDPRMRIVRHEQNLGLTAGLNRGLGLARGDWIARQDADDLSHPQRLAKQLAFLRCHPAVAAVGAQARLIDGSGRSLGKKDFPCSHRSIRWAHLFDNAMAHSAVTFRKSAVIATGGYDDSFRVSQDYDLWSRLGEKHLLANLPNRLVTLRIVESSITRTHQRPELARRIQREHGSRLFPGRVLTEEELDLLAQFRSSVEPGSLEAFLDLLTDLLMSYQAAWPETRISADFARTFAQQYVRVGYNLLPTARADGVRLIAAGVRVWPAEIFHLPWARIGALSLLGTRARELYERLRAIGRPSVF